MPSKAERKRTKRLILAVREKSFGDLLPLQIAADELEIDTDLAAATNRIEGRSMRMGKVEADRIYVGFRDQGRLSMVAVTEGEALGALFE